MKIKTLNIIMIMVGILIFVVGIYQRDAIICLFGLIGLTIGKKQEDESDEES